LVYSLKVHNAAPGPRLSRAARMRVGLLVSGLGLPDVPRYIGGMYRVKIEEDVLLRLGAPLPFGFHCNTQINDSLLPPIGPRSIIAGNGSSTGTGGWESRSRCSRLQGTKGAVMRSFSPPRGAFQPHEIPILHAAFEAVWQTIEAHRPTQTD